LVQVELVDFPKPWLLFNVVVGLSLGYMAIAFFRKWLGWTRGMREATAAPSDYKSSAMIWLAEVFLQRQLFTLSFPRWIIHILIFYGFIGLALLPAASFILKITGYLAMSGTLPRFYLHPEGYVFIKMWGDSFGLLFLLGLVMTGIRRLAQRQIRQTSNQLDVILLCLLLSVTLSGFVLEGLRLTTMPPEIANYSYVGRLFSPPGMHSLEQLQLWLTACWTLHFLLVATLFFYLPHSKLMHSLIAPVIIGLNAAEEHKREDLYWPEMKKYRETRLPQG
jgi:heterodisulfide reductase subunit E